MKRLGTLVVIALALVAAAIGLYVSAANRDPVVLDLLFWPQVSLRAGMLVVLAFVAGALTGMLVASLAGVAGLPRRRWQAVRQRSGQVAP